MQLYALCDQDLLDRKGISVLEFVNIAKVNDAKVLQYRNKNADMSFVKQQLINIRKEFDGFLIVNDFYELVPFCDGIHVGQEDLLKIDKNIIKAARILREVVSDDKLIGLSTHNKDEVVISNSLDINYIGLGAYRDTSTKHDLNTVLGDSLDKIAAEAKHPVAAIGGVKLDDKFDNVSYMVIGSGLLK